MAIVSSFGALTASVPPRAGLSTVSLQGSFYDGHRRTYKRIYETQPEVRTVIDFFARNIAQLGLHVFQMVSDTDRVRLRTHGLAQTIRRPNPSTTRYRLIETTVQDYLTYANAYWLKVRLPGRETLGLVRLPAEEVTVTGRLLPTAYQWSPGGACPEHPVAEDQVEAWPWDEDRQPLQAFDRIEQQMGGPIRPLMGELQTDLPVGRERQPILRHRWAQDIPTEPIQPLRCVGRDPRRGVQVEGLLTRVRPAGGGPLVRHARSWQAVPQRATGRVSRFGELRGLRGIRPRALVELVPYGVERLLRSEKQAGNPFATGQSHSVLGGLDAKSGVTNDMALNATVNPDFGQVEADRSVVSLSAFETYYAERRPFFVEGSDIFSPRISSFGTSAGDVVFYSRRIGRPPQYRPNAGPGVFIDQPDQTTILGAAKISGKTRNGLTVGVLDAVTSEERATIDLAGQRRDEAVEPMTNYLVGRIQQDLRGGNTLIGGMLTSVRRNLDQAQLSFLHAAAYAGGIDFAHYRQNKTYYVKGAGVFSHVQGTPEAILRTQQAAPRYFQRPDATYLTLDPTRTSLSGHGGSIEAGRAGNSRLILNASYAWRSPGLELNDVGFQRVADCADLRVQGGYRVFNPFSVFRRFGVEFASWSNFVGRTEYVGTGGSVAANAQLRNCWSWAAMWERDTEYLDTMMLRGGPAMKTSPYGGLNASLTSDGRKKTTFGINVGRRSDPNREIDSANAGITFGYRPSTALNVSIRPTWRANRASLQYVGTRQVGDEARYLVSNLDRQTFGLTVRLDYAVTPTLTVQYYGQPFLSVGQYSDFTRVTDPRAAAFAGRFRQHTPGEIATSAGQYLVDENQDGRTDLSFGNPDFAFRRFRSNLVVRWEYSPGSTLFVVWAQDRTGYGPARDLSIGSDMNALFQVVPRNVFLVEFSRRFAL